MSFYKTFDFKYGLMLGLVMGIVLGMLIFMLAFGRAVGQTRLILASPNMAVLDLKELPQRTLQSWPEMSIKNVEVESIQPAAIDLGRVSGQTWQGSPGVEQWRAILSQYPWDVDRMMRIIEHESHGDPNAYNPDGPYVGMFQQLNQAGEYDGTWQDPSWQIRSAYELWCANGYAPWSGTDY